MLTDILKKTEYYINQIEYSKHIDATPGNFVSLPESLDPQLVQKLREKGIEKIYSHQRKAFDLAEMGKNIIVTTPTASGKTLCFNLPVLNSLLKEPKSTYLYLYPTKALTEDQKKRLLNYNIKPHKIFSYDGDTPTEERGFIRQRSGIIFTNPDMLHLGILSHHNQWENYFYNLKYIVIDEFHHYKGTFASHISAIIRRLRRICKYYGSDPTFILSSATLSNPKEFAYNMTGLDFEAITESGAPTGEKELIFWNPPIRQFEDDMGKSVFAMRNTPKEAYNLAITLANRGKKVIVFPRSRKRVELMVKALREYFGTRKNIFPYRSGYTPEERRRIEKSLFAGEIDIVVATNALELGIDVGALDAVVTVGYPGSVSSLWQQFGRAGRKENNGIGVFIARDDLIDQYYMKRPEDFFEKGLDCSVVNNENEFILYNQIACAVCENPMTIEEILFYFGEKAIKIIGDLEANKLVRYSGHFYWTGKESPHVLTNIRGTGGDDFEIIEKGKLLGICDRGHLYSTLHEGAVYIHDGETYLVEKLDMENHKAFVKKTEGDFYTNVHEDIQIENPDRRMTYKTSSFEFDFGMCYVTTSMPYYEKKQFRTGKSKGKVQLKVPDTKLYTQCVFFDIDEETEWLLEKKSIPLQGAIHALEHILIGVAPILINCDRNDLGGVSYSLYEKFDKPCVFIYDGYEGGIGITKALFERKKEWVEIAYNTICTCSCVMGCPACIQSPKCGNNNQPLNKEGAKILLEALCKEL